MTLVRLSGATLALGLATPDRDDDPISGADCLAFDVHLPWGFVELTLSRSEARELLAGLSPLVAALGGSMTDSKRSGPIPEGSRAASLPPKGERLPGGA